MIVSTIGKCIYIDEKYTKLIWTMGLMFSDMKADMWILRLSVMNYDLRAQERGGKT